MSWRNQVGARSPVVVSLSLSSATVRPRGTDGGALARCEVVESWCGVVVSRMYDWLELIMMLGGWRGR